MVDSGIPMDVQAFLRNRLESYEQLEILLLLRARRAESWAQDTVAAELHMPEPVADHDLRALCRQGLLSAAVAPDALGFRYRAETPEVATLVDKVAAAYADHRIEIMRLMTTNAIERMRAGALRTFANAFVVGKKGGKDG
jgi:hypothetical protein